MISDYTEEGFLQFVEVSLKENVSDTDDVLDELLEQFEDILFHS
ncbi:bacteriocin immunity protein [Vibrio fluvialis]|nr:bacteriocin immunity protein [Vibrio parahaemolyticus]ELV8629378.1 bacteriocin immunity protein [Vibrio vulnificus]MCR9838015.1 bacteriocin immunity protein [Vibrio parahaemolyticus]